MNSACIDVSLVERSAVKPKPRLPKATVQTMLGTGAARVVGMVVAVVLAVLLGPARFGEYAFLSVSALVLGAFGMLGWGPIASREVAALETSEARRAASQMVVAISLTIGVVGLLAIPGVEVLRRIFDGPFQMLRWPSVPTVAVWALGVSLSMLAASVLAGHRDFVPMNILAFARSVVVGGAAATAAAWSHSVGWTAAATAAAELVVALGAVAVLSRRGLVNYVPGPGRVDHLVRLWKPAVGAGVASIAILSATWLMQLLLISQPGGDLANGGYALALRLSLIVTFAPTALAVASVPYVSRQRDFSKAWHTGRSVVLACVLLAGAVGALMALLSPAICQRLGAQYVMFAGTVALMSLSGVLVALNSALGNVAVGLRELRPWVRSDFVLAAVLVVAMCILVPRLSANGAVASLAVAYAVSCAYLGGALLRARSSRGAALHLRAEGEHDPHVAD